MPTAEAPQLTQPTATPPTEGPRVRLFGNQLRWAKFVVREAMKEYRSKHADSNHAQQEAPAGANR